MSKSNIWDITDRLQTQIKLDILKKYLRAWAMIVGEYYPKAYFVDCFAGRGKYHLNGINDVVAGSPIIALETSIEIREKKLKKGKKFDLNIIAIDSDKNNLVALNKFAYEITPIYKSKMNIFKGEFIAEISKVLTEIANYPAFFFIDPYGVKGLDKKTIDLIINRQGSTEIFLNYMKMGVQRVSGQYKNIAHEKDSIRVGAIKTISHMDKLFGDTSWIGKDEQELLKHFVNTVFGKNYKYVLNFSVPYPDRSGTIYNLLFATNYSTGEKIMKDIMTVKLFKGTLFEKYPFAINLNIK